MKTQNDNAVQEIGLRESRPLRETLTGSGPARNPLQIQINRFIAGFMRSRFKHIIEGFEEGHLMVTWPDGEKTELGSNVRQVSSEGLPAETVSVEMFNFEPVRRMAMNGSIGWAEAYIDGHWETDDLFGLFMLFLENERYFPAAVDGSLWARVGNTLKHRWNKNTLRGSRKNIARHYDLGNRFYELWLDQSMSYSSAIYLSEEGSQGTSAGARPEEQGVTQTLFDAQEFKISRVLQYLNPQEGDRVLEIGCGWGAMGHALHSRRHCGVIGISLSNEQLEYARKRYLSIEKDTEADSATLEFRYCDYREMQGTFDHIVSIEMFEAVGQEYWDNYFGKLAQLLKSGGSAVLQIITIIEDRFDDYAKQPDFIQKYIFPGGMLPTRTQLLALAEKHGFDIANTEFFGRSYARTLRTWRDNFENNLDNVRAQGFDDRFIRLWRYYLAYCEAGFTIGSTDVGLWTLNRR